MNSQINYDYHVHANVLRAPDKAEDFIKRAVELGLDELCITDHAPFAQFLAGDRIPVGATREYCARVRELADKYKEKITILCGIEMDYYPTLEAQIDEILSEGDFDYIIGSSHLHIAGMIDKPLSELTADEYAARCFENNLRAVKTGPFDTIAHIDMYRWIISLPERFRLRSSEVDLSRHEDTIRELFSEMEKHGVCLEVNTHLMAAGNVERVYPSAQLMSIAREYNLKYRFGSDAHAPASVGHGRFELTSSEIYKDCWR